MNKKTKLIVAGLGLVQLALLGNKSVAQEAQTLSEVVISTTKNNQKQSQTGKVVTVISREELERSSGRSLAQLLNQQPGIVVNGVGSNMGKDKSVFFRGAGSAYTVILVDGVLATDPSGTGGAFDLRLFSIDQVDRIEIIRGGQSTIYGSDAVAGVVNIITKKSADAGNHVYGVASAGSYNTFKGTIGLNSKVDAFTYNLSYSHLRTDGISEAANPIGNSQVFDKDGLRQSALNANFGVQLAKNFSVNPFVRYFSGHFDYDDDAFTDANNTSMSTHFNGGLNATYDLPKGKITLIYSHENTTREYQSSFPGKYRGRMNLVDAYYNQRLLPNVDLLLGIDNKQTAVTHYYNLNDNANANLFSTYASLFLHELSIFNLEVGGRYNKHNKYGENYTYSITPSLNVAKALKLFGTVSSAFRAPTLEMLFGQYGANLNLKPELATNYEAGATLNLLDQKVNLRVVGFKRNMKNAIIYGGTGYINQDLQKDKGFEIEPGLKLQKFTINGYYAYVEGQQVTASTTSDVLLRRPKNVFGANAGFQASDQLYVAANYKFTGERTDTDFSSYPFVNRSLKSYHMVDAYAEYALLQRKLKIFADLKNLTNAKYEELIGYKTMGFNVNAGLSFKL
ncbi:MAG: TonB-dependent receptor [Pedobacter sp.]|nr:TonB-dependent receptor [Pedobacter sp.]